MKLAYLDTKVWNLLADQITDHRELASNLSERGWKLALSNFNRVELEQTFLRKDSLDKASRLLLTLSSALEAGAAYVKDPLETIAEEMWAISRGGDVSFKYGTVDISSHLIEIKKQITEEVGELRKTELRSRVNVNERERTRIANMHPDLRERLRVIDRPSLRTWIMENLFGSEARSILSDMICMRFPEESRAECEEYARELLLAPKAIASRSIVRAHFYVFWRYARQERPGQPASRSLFDDTYHMVTASHCDMYITGDKDQLRYSELVLPNHCGFRLFKNEGFVSDFLKSELMDE